MPRAASQQGCSHCAAANGVRAKTLRGATTYFSVVGTNRRRNPRIILAAYNNLGKNTVASWTRWYIREEVHWTNFGNDSGMWIQIGSRGDDSSAKVLNISTFVFSYSRSPIFDLVGVQEEWICIMPTGYDKLHLFGVCKTVVENGEVHVQNWSFNHDDLGPLQNAINSAIARGWGQGKVKQETCKESHKFKMSGYPFCANGESTVKTRWMIAYLLDELSALGWELHCSADLATHDFDVSSLYFRRGRKSATLGPRAVVSLNKASRLRVYGPQQLKASIQNQMANMGVMQSVDDYAGTLNIKLNFSAWHCNGVATVQARNIILGTIEAAGRAGYELNATLDLMTKMTDKSSFFFTPHPQAQITQTIHYPAAYISLHESDKIRVVGPRTRPTRQSCDFKILV